MFNLQLKKNIKMLDEEIGKLMEELVKESDTNKQKVIQSKIDSLIELRTKLSYDKVNESYAKELIAGAVSLTGMVLVLKFEKADIITSKAFSMATKLFRG